MATYIFEPVHDPEIAGNSANWNMGLQQKGKPPHTILRTSTPGGCLRSLTASDRLYVLAHGNNEMVGGTRSDDTRETYTPGGLADLLRQEGLPFYFFDLRIFTCDSGTGYPSFAKLLKDALLIRGYSNVQVVGYQSKVHTNYFWFTSSREGSAGFHKEAWVDGQLFRASSTQRIF
jgi:hypothetical protein